MSKGDQNKPVFGKRREPHTIIIARGDSIRHFSIRPWVLGVVGSLVAAITVGYLTAATYLVLRDDLLAGTAARQARTQHSYEDRISALRTQVDRITSRQLLDQRLMENKVAELLSRQDQLTDRHQRLGPLLERAGGQVLPATAPVPTARPDIRAGTEEAPTTKSARLPAISAGAAWTTASISGVKTSFAAESVADRADRLFVRINKSLHSIEADQMTRLKALTEGAYHTADQIARTLKDAGLARINDDGSNTGGPLLPASAAVSFEDQVKALDDALAHLDNVKASARRYPLANPAPGKKITSRFGMRRDPIVRRMAFHSGMDFGARTGAPIIAPGDGTVIRAGWNGGYGRMVEIKHADGYTTRYGHMRKILVKKGQKVRLGDTIGKVGSSGRSTGPHLHYEVRKGGKPFDPQHYINTGRKLTKLLK